MPLDLTSYQALPVTAATVDAIKAALSYLPPAEVNLVLYHSTFDSPCNDGSASAMSAWLKIGDGHGDNAITYIPYNPSAKEPFNLDQLTGKNVLLLDCSFKLETLEAARAKANKVMILDHHMPEQKNNNLVNVQGCYFTPDNSAGVMAWLYFNGLEAPIPPFVDLVQRQDIFKLPNNVRVTTPDSDKATAALRTLKGFTQYKQEYPQFLKAEALERLLQTGAGILEANRLWCVEMAAKTQLCKFKPNDTDQYTVMALQLEPAKMREVTELGELIWKNIGATNPNKVDFVMFWCPREDMIQCSFRSKFRTGIGLDVAALAKKIAGPAGGGHDEAAGCSLKVPTNFLQVIMPATEALTAAPAAAAEESQGLSKTVLVTAAVVGAGATYVALRMGKT
jgi:oligoribonuclease NrnB/cAMP/cGMP phosphodiesterase (DHH superfamily)